MHVLGIVLAQRHQLYPGFKPLTYNIVVLWFTHSSKWQVHGPTYLIRNSCKKHIFCFFICNGWKCVKDSRSAVCDSISDWSHFQVHCFLVIMFKEMTGKNSGNDQIPPLHRYVQKNVTLQIENWSVGKICQFRHCK